MVYLRKRERKKKTRETTLIIHRENQMPREQGREAKIPSGGDDVAVAVHPPVVRQRDGRRTIPLMGWESAGPTTAAHLAVLI